MQATGTRKHLHRTDMHMAIVMIALLVLLTAGALITADRAIAPPAVVDSWTRPAPDSSIVRPVPFEQTRFVEMNQLPPAPPVPIPSIDRQEAIESYRLPEPTPLKPLSFEEIRFLEINMLPGDDVSS